MIDKIPRAETRKSAIQNPKSKIQNPRATLPNRAKIQRDLLAWFRRDARDLPWRRDPHPYPGGCTKDAAYRVWVSEIILQQTRVEQGTPYFVRFMAAFPDVRALARAPEDRVMKLWEGLGYYTRARNLHKAAKIIVEERNGAFPANAEEWRRLPGVGRYTAGAISSIAFNERTAVLDGNVKRVLSRLFDIAECIDRAAVETRLWTLADALVPARAPGDFNQAMMELGARLCTPRRPRCEECPVRKFCAARAAGTHEQRPVRRPAKIAPHRELVVAAIAKNGRYLLAKRAPGGLLGGLWEFPGGEILPGETHRQALARELRDALGIRIRVRRCVGSVEHAYSHLRVTLHVYLCEHTGGAPAPKKYVDAKWVLRTRLHDYALPKANHKFLPLLDP